MHSPLLLLRLGGGGNGVLRKKVYQLQLKMMQHINHSLSLFKLNSVER